MRAHYETQTPELEAIRELKITLRGVLYVVATLTSHAQEQYPHFESERGQKDIRAMLEEVQNATILLDDLTDRGL